MDIGKRIKKIRESLGLTQEEFGHKVGLSSGTVCHIEQGSQGRKKGIGAEIILRICKAFNIDANWLLTGEIKEKELPVFIAEERDVYEAKKLTPVPVINEVPAGYPTYPDIEDYIRAHIYLPRIPKQAFGLYVSGSSMKPEITDGDIIIIDPNTKELKRGDLGVFRIGEETTIKRYYPYKGGVLLQPTNRKFPPLFMSADDQCELIGKVIYKIIKC